MKYETYTERKGAMHRTKIREIPEVLSNIKGTKLIETGNIVVEITIDNEIVKFQADEISQNRLVVKGYYMQCNNITSVVWKDFDNKIIQITAQNIADILEKASTAQNILWGVEGV